MWRTGDLYGRLALVRQFLKDRGSHASGFDFFLVICVEDLGCRASAIQSSQAAWWDASRPEVDRFGDDRDMPACPDSISAKPDVYFDEL